MHFRLKLIQLYATYDTGLDVFIACWYSDRMSLSYISLHVLEKIYDWRGPCKALNSIMTKERQPWSANVLCSVVEFVVKSHSQSLTWSRPVFTLVLGKLLHCCWRIDKNASRYHCLSICSRLPDVFGCTYWIFWMPFYHCFGRLRSGTWPSLSISFTGL